MPVWIIARPPRRKPAVAGEACGLYLVESAVMGDAVVMAIANTVEHYLMRHQVPYDVMMHPYAASSRDTASAAHIPADRLAKAVLLRERDHYIMAIVPASHYVHLNALRRRLGRRVELVGEKEAQRLFADCSHGAIPALGPAYGIETWLDEELAEAPEVYFEAGDHELLLRVSGECFLTLLRPAQRANLSHHA